MTDDKKLPEIEKTEKIIATRSSEGGKTIDVFCEGTANPFHIEATKHTIQELIDYIWNIPNFENEEDL